MFGFEERFALYIVEIFSNIEILKMYQKSANYLISVKISRFINL